MECRKGKVSGLSAVCEVRERPWVLALFEACKLPNSVMTIAQHPTIHDRPFIQRQPPIRTNYRYLVSVCSV